MESNKSVWPTVLAVVLVIMLIVNCFALYTVAKQGKSVPSADAIAAKVIIPAVQPYNDTALSGKVDKLSNEVFKDDTWKASAKALATSEFSAKEYKDIFNFLDANNVSIVEKSDISSVVVKDEKVSSFDVEEQDATVVHCRRKTG